MKELLPKLVKQGRLPWASVKDRVKASTARERGMGVCALLFSKFRKIRLQAAKDTFSCPR